MFPYHGALHGTDVSISSLARVSLPCTPERKCDRTVGLSLWNLIGGTIRHGDE